VPQRAAHPASAGPSAGSESRQRHRGRTIVISLLVLVVLGGAAGALEWNRLRKPAATVVTTTTVAALPPGDPIASQSTDPRPLTTTEVFGSPTIPSGADGSGYSIVKSESVADCTSVATDKIAALLGTLGCTQAIRATLTSADGTYAITTGIVNLPDAKAAGNARTSIKSLVAAGTGRFVGVDANGLPSAAQSTTHLGWDSRGHYLTYAVIALANGKPIASSDKNTATIINDVIEDYLGATIIGARESSASPTP
jgi:hypothetical protein